MKIDISVLGVKPMFVFIIAVLMVINIFLFSKTEEISGRVTSLEGKIKTLHAQNRKLEQEYYSISSLTNLDKLAKGLGFVKRAGTVYLEKLDYAMSQ